MATEKHLLSYDIAFGAHSVLGIEFALAGFLDLYKAVYGYSEGLSAVAAMLSLFVLLPSIIFVVPTAIVLSLLRRDGRLLFLTLLFALAFFSTKGKISTILIAAPYTYTLTSIWCLFEWFSKRRKTHSAI